MTRKDDLEQHIRDAYSLILECENILRLSDRPKEKARARRAIEEQWGLIQGYLNEYLPLCRRTGAPLPADIRDIATRFEDVRDDPVLSEGAELATATRPSETTYVTYIDHAEGLAKLERMMISILFLTAEPTDTARLRLGEEMREVQEKLQLAKTRDNFTLHHRFSVRPEDISQAFLDLNPQFVHFSGHGTTSGEICIEDRTGKVLPIQPEALAALFEQFANQVKCVLLNACYSEIQAQAISNHIDYVVGMNKAIGDKAAIAFSVGFYQALGAGRSIEDSYKLGCTQIRLQGISEHLTPVLISKPGVKASPKNVNAAIQISAATLETSVVHIEISATGMTYDVETPINIRTGDLKLAIIQQLNLPTRYNNDVPVSFTLFNMTQGQMLYDDSTLLENSVKNGDTLVFVPPAKYG